MQLNENGKLFKSLYFSNSWCEQLGMPSTRIFFLTISHSVLLTQVHKRYYSPKSCRSLATEPFLSFTISCCCCLRYTCQYKTKAKERACLFCLFPFFLEEESRKVPARRKFRKSCLSTTPIAADGSLETWLDSARIDISPCSSFPHEWSVSLSLILTTPIALVVLETSKFRARIVLHHYQVKGHDRTWFFDKDVAPFLLWPWWSVLSF